MSCKYHYDISPDALYHPAADKTPEDFFVQWSADDLATDDTGTLQRAWPQTDITRNQQQARAAYPPKTLLQADATSSGAFFDDLFDVIKDRLSLDRIPFRDLADHAPLNYVSAFTGRG